MKGEEFRCCICDTTYWAGFTPMKSTEALPGAIFWCTGDKRGMWVGHEGKTYCGPCSDKEFPQIVAEGVKFKHDGTICF